jgi:hypothetical protein
VHLNGEYLLLCWVVFGEAYLVVFRIKIVVDEVCGVVGWFCVKVGEVDMWQM